jgi:putative acyl-CoA dehydrogenase
MVAPPRTDLDTHRVTNQPAPLVDVNLFAADSLLSSMASAAGGDTHRDAWHAFGHRVGSAEAQAWADEANRYPPVLRAFDRYGARIDEVSFHPSYHALMRLGIEAGVSSIAWTAREGGHVAHTALLFLMSEADAGVTCPMSMTYAAVPALRADAAIAARWVPRLASARYDARCVPAVDKAGCTFGMAMTEKQGGSDVRANRTLATAAGDGSYRLRGHKWFCSAPMSDGFLTLAKVDGADDALTCFVAPKWRPADPSSPDVAHGEMRNAIELQRLKDKLGDRSNASSEIEYRDAWAERLGAVGEGVRTIIAMVQHTRLDCVTGSAAVMRFAVMQAHWHAERRSVFGKRLVEQPLMRAVLADLTLEAAAAMALSLRLARAFDRAAVDPVDAAWQRIATPVAKYWVCKRCPAVVAEAMECLGGAGYVEESVLPRLYRQAPLNGIWEGSGNVIALDALRAMGRDAGATALLREDVATALRGDGDAMTDWMPRDGDEGAARERVERLAVMLAAAALDDLGEAELAAAWRAVRGDASRALTMGASAALRPWQDMLLARGRLAAG